MLIESCENDCLIGIGGVFKTLDCVQLKHFYEMLWHWIVETQDPVFLEPDPYRGFKFSMSQPLLHYSFSFFPCESYEKYLFIVITHRS